MSHREPLTGQEIGYALASPTLAQVLLLSHRYQHLLHLQMTSSGVTASFQSVGALHRILTSSSEDVPALSIFHQV